MGPFDHIQKKGSVAIKPQPAQIRREIISTVTSVKKTSNVAPRKDLSREKAKTAQTTSSHVKGQSVDGRKKTPNLHPRLESDSDDNGDRNYIETENVPRKRQRMSVEGTPDISREIRNQKSFIKDGHGIPTLVHAADIANVRDSTKYRRAFPKTSHLSQVDLHYPAACAVER